MGKPKGHLSAKSRRVIGALVSGEARTQKEAAEIAGVDESHVSRLLKMDSVKEMIRDNVSQRLKTVGLTLAARVAEALVETAESEYVRADMAKHIMGIAGVKPEREAATTNVGSVHLTVLMGDDKLTLAASNTPQTIDITPEPGTVPVTTLMPSS